MDDTMEELESLMLKLEQVKLIYLNTFIFISFTISFVVFQGFQAVLDPLLVAKPKRGGIEGTIGEIGDLVNAFSTQFIQHHEL